MHTATGYFVYGHEESILRTNPVSAQIRQHSGRFSIDAENNAYREVASSLDSELGSTGVRKQGREILPESRSRANHPLILRRRRSSFSLSLSTASGNGQQFWFRIAFRDRLADKGFANHLVPVAA